MGSGFGQRVVDYVVICIDDWFIGKKKSYTVIELLKLRLKMIRKERNRIISQTFDVWCFVYTLQ